MDNLGYVEKQDEIESRNKIPREDVSNLGIYKISTIDEVKKRIERNVRKKSGIFPLHNNNEIPPTEIQLKPKIGLLSAMGIIVSNVVGSGIFITPQGVLKGSGSVGLCLVIWLLCGLFTILGTLSYVELGTVIQDSGGTYIYLLEGLAPHRKYKKSWWRPLPAYLYSWQNTLFGKPAMMAIIVLTCSEYIVRLCWTNCLDWTTYSSPEIAVKLIAACLLGLVAFINCYSVKLSAKIQNTFAVFKILAIFLIILGGCMKCNSTTIKRLNQGFEGSSTSFSSIANAFYCGLWSFNGWQNLNYVTKEMKNPFRDLPRAIIPANFFVVTCFLLVNMSYFIVLSADELIQSETVAVGFGQKIGGKIGEMTMILFVSLSAFGSANGGSFTAGRLCHASAKEGHMADVFSYINEKRFTPTSAIVFNFLLSLLMVIPSDIKSLISLNGFTSWGFIGAAQISLIVMRFDYRKNNKRALRVNLFIPIILLIFSIFLLVAPIIDSPSMSYFYVTGFLALGLCAYFPLVYWKLKVPFTDEFRKLVQKIFLVLPADENHNSIG